MAHDVLPIRFQSSVHAGLTVETSTHAALLDRAGPGFFEVAQRPGFGVMLLVREGRGLHTVDFEQVELRASRVLLVRPGQVHQWHPGTIDASIVMIRPEASGRLRRTRGRVAYADLSLGRMQTAIDAVAALEREQAAFTASAARLMADLAGVLLSIFEDAQSGALGSALPPAYLAFVDAVEANLGTARNARSLVADLGYSERTVTRACHQVVGLSAKGVLDERIVLEAKRLLAHTDRAIGDIGAELGFTEPSNFNKFFRRHTTQLPSGFRQTLRSAGVGPET